MFKICYQENYLYPILQFNDFQKELDSCMRFSFPSQTPPKKKKILAKDMQVTEKMET